MYTGRTAPVRAKCKTMIIGLRRLLPNSRVCPRSRDRFSWIMPAKTAGQPAGCHEQQCTNCQAVYRSRLGVVPVPCVHCDISLHATWHYLSIWQGYKSAPGQVKALRTHAHLGSFPCISRLTTRRLGWKTESYSNYLGTISPSKFASTIMAVSEF